jgi:hypothetical protein
MIRPPQSAAPGRSVVSPINSAIKIWPARSSLGAHLAQFVRSSAYSSRSHHRSRLVSRDHLLISSCIHLELRHVPRGRPLRRSLGSVARPRRCTECRILPARRSVNLSASWHWVADLQCPPAALIASTRELARPPAPCKNAKQKAEQSRRARTGTDANADLGSQG